MGYFNSWNFYCSHSISWRYYFTLCSVTSIAEGCVAIIFIVLSVKSNLYRAAFGLVLVLMMVMVLEWMRASDVLSIIKAYSWKFLGISIGFILAKNLFNWKKCIVVFILFLLMGGYFLAEIDRGIIKTCLKLNSFIVIAYFISQIKKSTKTNE